MDHLEKLFLAHGGIMKTCELKEAGYYYKKIQSLIESGKIERVRQGYYQYVGEDSFSDIPVIASLFPDAVICMESALIIMAIRIERRQHGIWLLRVQVQESVSTLITHVSDRILCRKIVTLWGLQRLLLTERKLKSMIGNGRWWIFCFIETR